MNSRATGKTLHGGCPAILLPKSGGGAEEKNMVIKYKLADGQLIDVEVSPEVAATLEEFDRIEASWNRKARRRKVASYEAINEETGWEPTDTTVNIESDYITREECRELVEAVGELSAENCKLVHNIFYVGLSIKTIAEQQMVCFQSVYKRLNRILASLQKSLAS